LRSDSRTVWFMTQNPGKFREALSILSSYGIRVRQLNQAKLEIQDRKLENVASFALRTALVDENRLIAIEDSGLFIRSLDGFPGPFSSYALDTIGLDGVLDLLRNRKERTAYFQCSLAVGSRWVKPLVFTGVVKGRIAKAALGNNGFGFDPIFIPDGSVETFGQLDESFKTKHSHRAKAFAKFARWHLTEKGLSKVALK
jgi:XTP/dITP diphosphohydrolase